MANYYGRGRTNAFAVKDVAALTKALEPYEIEVHPATYNGSADRVVLLAADGDGAGMWDCARYDDAADDYTDVWIPDLIADHLQDGQVAVFVHVGSEKLRYLVGYAVAVHSDGRQVQVRLDDIYERAATAFGVESRDIADASY